MKKFSSFLYNDSPIDKEYSGSSTQDEGTELKVDNDLNCKGEVVTFNNQVSRHLPTQLENCNFTSELESLGGIKAGLSPCLTFTNIHLTNISLKKAIWNKYLNGLTWNVKWRFTGEKDLLQKSKEKTNWFLHDLF